MLAAFGFVSRPTIESRTLPVDWQADRQAGKGGIVSPVCNLASEPAGLTWLVVRGGSAAAAAEAAGRSDRSRVWLMVLR